MNRIARLVPIFALSFFFAAVFTGRAHTAPANTVICSSITTNTVWTTAQSPIEVCDTSPVTVQSGATLTIQPGVTVIFDGSQYQFTVLGTMNALGTADQPITITAKTASAGSWRGIAVDNTGGPKAVLNMDYTTMLYGGFSGSFGAEIYANVANITINHSHIRNSAGSGIYASGSTNFSVQNTSFDNNGQDAIELVEPKTDLALTGLTASGNVTNAVHVTGLNTYMGGQRRWANPGIPYLIDGAVSNNPGDVLTIDPGAVMDFSNSGRVSIAGELLAQGTQTQPITMTSLTKTPGDWIGITGDGGTKQAVIQLDYVTVEYAGRDIGGAIIQLGNGKLTAHHSIIRNSSKDGVQLAVNSLASVVDSQIYGNAGYGAKLPVNQAMLASNNWWGSASGPHPDNSTCGSGSGDKVSTGVLFLPFANAPNATQVFPLTSAPAITLSPRRWYTPADGVARIYFDITLRDGNGNPLPGRTVNLNSTLGNPTSGGITDLNGKTLAYLTSNSTGDATVTASLVPANACEAALSPESVVTFTTPINITDLMPDGQAPYFNGDISLTPMPVIVGITTTITAKLTNPLTVPVTTDVEFSFVQSGLGLQFGPIKTIMGEVIPANSSMVLKADFVPPFSGHYCVQVAYTLTKVGAKPLLAPQPNKQLKPFNANPQQSTTSNNNKPDGLAKTRTSLKQVNRFVGRAYDNSIVVPLAVANAGIEWDLNNADKISNALQGDPPRQDYTVISLPEVLQLPPTQAGGGITQARADALNAVDSALAQANAYGTAAEIAFDRAGGAAQAGDLNWESAQDGVMLQYNYQYGQALITASQKIDALLKEAASEGVTSVVISASAVAAMQAQLASGFTSQELADAHALGLSDADIEAIRQSIITSNPADLAGDVVTGMKDISTSFLTLGNILTNPTTFAPGLTVSGGATPLKPQAAGNTMVQIHNTVTTLQVGNSTGITATIDLSARPINLPADWAVQVSPSQVTLPAGGQITATVSIVAGAPVPQGSILQVAVEGHIGTQLLGGVAVEVLAPYYRPFDGRLHVYLPVVNR